MDSSGLKNHESGYVGLESQIVFNKFESLRYKTAFI